MGFDSPAAPGEGRILILAPTGNDARLTSQILSQAGIEVHICPDIRDVSRAVADQCAAIILAEETLRADAIPVLVNIMGHQPPWSDIPVIIITSAGEADQARLRRLAVFGPGANVTLLERPFRPGTLLSTAQAAVRSRQRQYLVRDLLQSVRSSEERYQHILHSISDAFIAISRDWRITYVNDSYLRMVAPLGLTASDLLGRELWQAVTVQPETGAHLRRAMAEQQPDSLEVFHPTLRVWLEIRIYPSPETLTIYHRDITGRKQQQEELAELSRKVRDQARTFDATLSHITDFAYTFDLQGRFTYINKPLLDLWGLTLDQAVGKNFFELNYPAELAQKLQDQIQHVISTGKPLTDDTPYTNPLGQPGFFEYIFNPIFAPDGSVEGVAGSTRDITERKRTVERLRDSDAQITAIIDHSPVGMYLLGSDLRIQQVNQKALPVFGNIGNPVGRPFDEVMRLLWAPKAAAELEARFRHTLETGEPYFESGFAEDRKDQAKRDYYDWQINRIRLSDGRFGVVCYFIDISAHVAAQQKIREARDAAERASRAKDDFLAALSHELRTPLNPVLLLASESAADPSLTPQLRHDFDLIAKNVALEAHLIDDLLDLTRITRGKLVIETRPVAVRQILQDAAANVQAEVHEKQLTLVLNLGAGNPVVVGDPVRLQQVFWNILKNAAKFTPTQGRITLSTRTVAPAGPFVIEITDNGAGMTPDELARIFDAFAQGDHATVGSPHRFGGLGLGLAISRSLVELHSGTIRASSAGLGQGSTFTIELPLAATQAGEEATEGAPTTPSRASRNPHTAGLRILLVEDHSPTRAVLSNLLEARNHRVTTASTVGEGKKFGMTQDFDLLITDIGLPDGDGYELMKELGPQRGLKAIALTGYGAEQDVARARAAGFIAHLTKPVSVVTLDGVLDTVMSTGVSENKSARPPT